MGYRLNFYPWREIGVTFASSMKRTRGDEQSISFVLAATARMRYLDIMRTVQDRLLFFLYDIIIITIYLF